MRLDDCKVIEVAMYAVAAALLFQMVSSLRTYPNYIPYANEAFGGPDKSHRYLRTRTLTGRRH